MRYIIIISLLINGMSELVAQPYSVGDIRNWQNGAGYMAMTDTVPTNKIMTKYSANQSIATLQTQVNAKYPLTGNPSGFISTEVDGSTTNEIELPAMSGKTGQTLSNNGSSPGWIPSDYKNTVTTSSGVATFYLTSDKTSSGTALYTSVTYVNPVVNDVGANYVYGWTISGDKKTLTMTAKSAVPTGVIALLGISILGAPTSVANGTAISVCVSGN